MIWVIAALFMISFTGLAYSLVKTISSGAEAYSGTYAQDTAHEFEDVFLFIPPKRIAELGWLMAIILFILAFCLTGSLTSRNGFIVGILTGSLFGIIGLKAPRWFLKILKSRRLHKFNLQLVDTLINMSNALKAGFSITQAFESVVKNGENPIAQEFSVCLQQTRVGVNLSEALSNMEQRIGSADLTLMVLAIETARKTGGNLTEIFEKIAATIRERMRIENRIRTLTSQGRLQGIIVGCMPIVIGVAMFLVDPQMMLPFFHSMFGVIAILITVILITLGGLIIRKIINIDV